MFFDKDRVEVDVPQVKNISSMSEYYNVYDTTGHIVRGYFKTWKDAYTFLCVTNRFDWSIKKAI